MRNAKALEGEAITSAWEYSNFVMFDHLLTPDNLKFHNVLLLWTFVH